MPRTALWRNQRPKRPSRGGRGRRHFAQPEKGPFRSATRKGSNAILIWSAQLAAAMLRWSTADEVRDGERTKPPDSTRAPRGVLMRGGEEPQAASRGARGRRGMRGGQQQARRSSKPVRAQRLRVRSCPRQIKIPLTCLSWSCLII